MPDSVPVPVPALLPLAPGAPLPGMPLPVLPDDDGLDPLLPLPPEELELLDPEPPLLELGPLEPPALGDEAPELDGEEGGEGTEGVVGVLAEGQPINSSMAAITPPASNRRARGT